MPAQESDEDAIDSQVLQAQIDLSMSFAQNLVTSWVKPTHFPNNRRRDLENEIKEYMRSPARLGVGAPIPETQSLVREAARLKSKLEGGKKRQKKEEGVGATRQQSDDEQEESRTAAIRKKARLDPFDVTSKKRRRNAEVKEKPTTVIHPVAAKAISQLQLDTATEDEPDADEVAKVLLGAPESSTPEVPKKRKESTRGKQQEAVAAPTAAPLTGSEPTINEKTVVQIPSLLSENPKSCPPLVSPATTREKIVDVSLKTPPLLSPSHRTTNADFFEQPLLNLNGSPRENETDDEKLNLPSPVPKKRRKRRKKKRSMQNAEAASTEVHG